MKKTCRLSRGFSPAGEKSQGGAWGQLSIVGRLFANEWLRTVAKIKNGQFTEAQEQLPLSTLDILRERGGPLAILPVGDVSFVFLEMLCRVCWEAFGIGVVVLRKHPLSEFTTEAGYLDGDAVINRLADPKEGFLHRGKRVMILTPAEVKTEKHGVVYGYAGMQIPVGIISTFRMIPSPGSAVPYRRFLRTCLHEIGHTFGLPHCADLACVMHEVIPGKGVETLSKEFCVLCVGRMMVTASGYKISLKSGEEAEKRGT